MSWLLAMWPMMTVSMEVPMLHRVSLHTTGVEYLRKERRISRPGRRMQAGRRGSRLFHRAKPMATANSTTRLVRVATAAPVTPMAGAPRRPKMSTKLRKVFTHMEMAKRIMPKAGYSVLRCMPA